MMTKIREKTHVLLYVLVFCFVALIVVEWGAQYSDVGSQSRGTIGKINGDDIRYADFSGAYTNQVNQARQQKDGESLTDAEIDQISEQIWSQFIEEKLLRKFIDKNSIVVGDSDIVNELKNNPPEFIKNSPAFLTDGKFDASKYAQALNNPQFAKEWAQVEGVLRAQMPYNKLQAQIGSVAHITESELRQEYARRNLKLNGQLIYFSPAEFSSTDIQISDDEIKNYYNAHTDEFKEQEKSKLAYVSFDDSPTSQDSTDVIEKIADVKKQVLEKKDFSELAKLYSSDRGANQSGGSLGWFTKGAMVREFEEACFNDKVKKGDVIGPVLTTFGYHIIRIDSTRFAKDRKSSKPLKKGDPEPKDSVLAHHILIKMEASQTTIETARENASLFYETAKEESFAAAYEKYRAKYNLKADTTLEIVKNESGVIAGFPDRMKNIQRFAFSEKPGSLARPNGTHLGFTVFTIVSHTDEGMTSLANAKEKIRATLLEEKRKDMAFKKAQEFRAKINSIADVTKIDSSITVRQLTNFLLANSVPGVGRDARLNGAIFNLPISTLSDAIKGARGAYIVQITSKEDINEAKYQDSRMQLKQALIGQKQQRAYREWLEAMKKKAKIEDFRALFNL